MAVEQFRPWRRPAMTALASRPAAYHEGRLKATLPLALSDGGATRTAGAEFVLTGPGDIDGLDASAIRVRSPSPGHTGAEAGMVAFAEFAEPDLPWRYTPELNPDPAQGLKPWLVLLVGGTGTEIVVSGRDAHVTGALLDAHRLERSAAWAHVHDLADGTSVGRILSPRALQADTHYTAALVPAYRIDAGTPVPRWRDGGGDLDVPCHDSWSFRTRKDPDDFKTIAERLAPLSEGELLTLGEQHFGVAAVASGPAGPDVLALGGALTRPVPPEETPLPGPVAQRVGDRARLTWSTQRPWVLGLPRYDGPWTERPGDEPGPLTGWRQQLHEDPRHRGVAGLGAWAAIAWQERISDGAAAQAGAIAAAGARLSHLGLGLRAARSQWQRRVPADPGTALAVLAPMLRRLPVAGGGSAMDALTGRTPHLVPALVSSAARRMLRPRSAVSRAALPGATALPGLLHHAATTCPPDPGPPVGQEPVVDALAQDPEVVVERLRGLSPDLVWLAAEAIAASDAEHGGHVGEPVEPREPEEIVPAIAESGGDLVDVLVASRPRPTCRPIAIDETAVSVVDAIDPHLSTVVVDRVAGGISGLRDPVLAPPDLALELDIPFWSFLRDHAPDWLLPGAGAVPEDRVVALATNPGFVDAFLVGANVQALAELRRRNLPVTAGWMPLRRFWQRISDDGTSASATDVVSVLDASLAANWPEGTPLGDPSHQRGTPAGPMLVLLLSTELFREYPHTQVFLVPAVAEQPRWATLPDVARPARIDPVLAGGFTPELVFFGFPVPPGAVADHWLVLEEPPPGYRFHAPTEGDALLLDGARYAHDTLHEAVRAFFGNLL